MNTKYKLRHKETYKGVVIDVRANDPFALAEKLQKRRDKIDDLGIGEPMTVSRLCDKWVKLREPHVLDTTINGYMTYINRIKTLKMNVADVVSSDLQMLLNDEVPNNRSNEFFKKYYTIIKSVFQLAVSDRIIVWNPADGLKRPQGTSNERRALDDWERSVLVEAIDRSEHAMAFIPMLYCGLRPSEVRRLQGKHIDLESRVIHVPGTKSKAAVRDVPIPERVVFRFAGYKKEEYLITTRWGNKVTGDRFGVWWHTLWMDMNRIAGAEFFRGELVEPVIDPKMTSYYLRHTYCTDLERAGVPVTVACRLMGHSSIEITQKIYTHANKDSFNAAMQKIDELNTQKFRERKKVATIVATQNE